LTNSGEGDERPFEVADKPSDGSSRIGEEERKKITGHAIENCRKAASGGMLHKYRAGLCEIAKILRLFGECAEIAAVSRVRNVASGVGAAMRQGKAK